MAIRGLSERFLCLALSSIAARTDNLLVRRPLVSIIIPSLNMGRYLERTLLSILRQDYPAVEVIVADGGSTDETTEILSRYPAVKWWSGPDGGIVNAINRAIDASTGEVLAVQACDDFYLRGAFTHCLDELAGDPELDIVAGCDVYLEADGKTFRCSALDDHEITPWSLLMRRVIPIHAAFLRRRVLDTVRFRQLGDAQSQKGGNVGNVGIDVDFWYRALHFHRARFIPHHVAVYQHHDGQMTRNSRHWYRNQTGIVESAEQDRAMARRHRFTDSEKENLYVRWQVQQRHLDGNETEVARLVEMIMSEPRFTEQTRQFLRLHGFAAELPKEKALPRHRNHRVPDFQWMMEEAVKLQAA